MDEINWNKTLSAYRKGLRADIVRAKYQGRWGTEFTLRPNAPEAVKRAVWQFEQTRPEALRHSRRAVLKSKSREQQVILVTEWPGRRQSARDIQTFEDVSLSIYLHDAVLDMLEAVLAAANASR